MDLHFLLPLQNSFVVGWRRHFPQLSPLFNDATDTVQVEKHRPIFFLRSTVIDSQILFMVVVQEWFSFV